MSRPPTPVPEQRHVAAAREIRKGAVEYVPLDQSWRISRTGANITAAVDWLIYQGLARAGVGRRVRLTPKWDSVVERKYLAVKK